MSTVALIFQAANGIGALVILALIVYMFRRWPTIRLLLIFPALWTIYGTAFYTLAFLDRLSTAGILIWSASYRSLSMAMILANLLGVCMILLDPSPDLDIDDDTDEC